MCLPVVEHCCQGSRFNSRVPFHCFDNFNFFIQCQIGPFQSWSCSHSVTQKRGQLIIAIVSIAVASVVTIRDRLEVPVIHSYSRGCHAYMDIWTPTVGDILLSQQTFKILTQWLFKEDINVGHAPHNLALKLSAFLRRDNNKVFAQITGDKVNRNAGYGLEIPCVYR